MILGVIADDFTGGTDIASFLVKGGMSTIQLIGVPHESDPVCDADAVVISLKSRSAPTTEAISDSVAAARYLKKHGAKVVFFKYCSTFDSTEKGNIGPVTEALMRELGVDFAIFSPALPVNGREVFNGYLFVKGVPLHESPMRNHPVTPMHESNVMRLVEMQSSLKCGLVNEKVVKAGAAAILEAITQLRKEGFTGAVIDAIDEADLLTQGEAFKDFSFVTGGSGLGLGLAKAFNSGAKDLRSAEEKGRPNDEKTVVLSGSCSAMTNAQVAQYKKEAPAWPVDIEACVISEEKTQSYAAVVAKWAAEQTGKKPPIIYATANPEVLKKIQAQFGAKASSDAIEAFFYALSTELKKLGFKKFIVAGGETSGQVTKALGVKGFYIGPTIAPGVPWVKAINEDISLALKSGNFGEVDFFNDAQGKF